MRIAIVSSSFDRRHRRRLAIYDSLINDNHICKVFHLDMKPGAVLSLSGAQIIDKPILSDAKTGAGRGFSVFKNAVIKTIESFKPDVILCLEPESLFVGVYFKTIHKKRFVYDVQEFHGHTTGSGLLRRFWVYKEERKAWPHIDQILLLSSALRSYLKKKHRRLPNDAIISNAIPITSNLQYNGYLHQQAKLPDNKKIILYHGYLARSRGLLWLADFSKKLPDEWHLVLMGWGELENELLQKQSQSFSVIPPVEPDDLLNTIMGADLGAILYDPVNLNHINSTPNKLYEYSAVGVPVIVEELPEISRLVRKNNLGWVVSKSDPEKELLEIFSQKNHSLLKSKGQSGRAFSSNAIKQNTQQRWARLIVGLN